MNIKRLFFSIFLIFSLLATPVLAVEQQHVVTFGQNLNFSKDRLDEAVSKIGSTAKASIVLRYGTWNLDANQTITDNINFQIPPGAVLDGAYTLTIQGNFNGSKGCFGSSLTVVFDDGSVDEVLPKWFDEECTGSMTRTLASIAVSGIPIYCGKIASDPITTGWGLPEGGTRWFNSTDKYWKVWNGEEIVTETAPEITTHSELLGLDADDHAAIYLDTSRHDLVARHPLTVGGTGATTAGGARTALLLDKWIDASYYATLELADTAATAAGKLLVISQNYTLTANTTLTAKVKVIPGGSFTKASTYTLAFSDSFENPSNGQCFIGFDAGDVTFGSLIGREIHYQWFNSDAIALASVPASGYILFLSTGISYVAGNVGIGTSSPSAKLSVLQSGSQPAMDSTTGVFIQSATASAEASETGAPLIVRNTQNMDKAIVQQWFTSGALANNELSLFGSGDRVGFQSRSQSAGTPKDILLNPSGGNVVLGGDFITKGPWVDVRAYGASTAETPANNSTYIQAAISGNPGKAILLPEIYEIASTITITPSTATRIFGLGRSISGLYSTANIPLITIDTTAGDIYYIEMNKLYLANGCSGTRTGTRGIFVTGDHNLYRSTFKEIHSRGNYIGVLIDSTVLGTQWCTWDDFLFDNYGGNTHSFSMQWQCPCGLNTISNIRSQAIDAGLSFLRGLGDSGISLVNHDGGNYGIYVYNPSAEYSSHFTIGVCKFDNVVHPVHIEASTYFRVIGNAYLGGNATPIELSGCSNYTIDAYNAAGFTASY